jgi:hypothetical protein
MSEVLKVGTSADFKRLIVDRDYVEYLEHPADLRCAYHLALGLFHLWDWTYWEFSGKPNWPYGSKEEYRAVLEAKCSYFGYMRDLANSVKHAEINRNPSTQMEGLASTSIMPGAFDPRVFDPNVFQTEPFIVSRVAPGEVIGFERAAKAVMRMWNAMFAAHEWMGMGSA